MFHFEFVRWWSFPNTITIRNLLANLISSISFQQNKSVILEVDESFLLAN